MKNIVIVMMRYLTTKLSHKEMVEVFGEKDGNELWFRYSDRFTGNPCLFFDRGLNEQQQNALTLRAQMLSLSPNRSNVENALLEMTVWPTSCIKAMLVNLLEDVGSINIQDNEPFEYDFPCANGIYRVPVEVIVLEDGIIWMMAQYKGIWLKAKYENENPIQMRNWIQQIKEKYGK